VTVHDSDPAVPWVVLEHDAATSQWLARHGVTGRVVRRLDGSGELVRLSVPLSAARLAAVQAALAGQAVG
jgi:hypothetical protein